jgi:uncharacterized membrane protein YGL010W
MWAPLDSWRRRHLNPANLWLHVVGIPACFAAAPVLLLLQTWWWALGVFIGGYMLQFVGHAIEGNQSGEEMLLRRLTGRDRGRPT